MSAHPKFAIVLGLITFFTMVLSWILFVIFGQVTVRRLRRNPATRNRLGVELISGWDIVQASSALSRSRRLTKRLERGPLRGYFADSQTLRAHTTRLDRALAAACYWGLRISAVLIVTSSMYHQWGR